MIDVHGQAVARAGPKSSARARLHAFFKSTFSPPNLDQTCSPPGFVFWSMHRYSPQISVYTAKPIARTGSSCAACSRVLQTKQGSYGMSLRTAAIGLTALLDGPVARMCLDPENFSPREAIRLCEGRGGEVFAP